MVGPEGIQPLLIYKGFFQKVRDFRVIEIITLFMGVPHPVLDDFER
jgi:hypothetical protein